MYSRKYIRSPAMGAPAIQRISPTGGVVLPSISRAEERIVSLPPDYTGMAFSGSEKNSSLQNPGDYPETRILSSTDELLAEEDNPSTPPPIEEPPFLSVTEEPQLPGAQSSEPQIPEIQLSEPPLSEPPLTEPQLTEPKLHSAEAKEAPFPLPFHEESDFPAEPWRADQAEETTPIAEQLPPSETAPASSASQWETPPSNSPSTLLPLLTPELLRSLTLEDLLLFWMLLLLMVSSQEDQIYLLLGLLLFER